MPAPEPRALLRARLAAQGLSGPSAASAAEVAGRLLAVQAQDRIGFRLAVRARTGGLTADDVDRELSEERSVVVTWLNRGTLHLVRAEDYWWLHRLVAPGLLGWSASGLARLGVPPGVVERGVETVAGALEAEGPLTRPQLGERLAAAGVPTAGQVLPHLLMRANLLGHAVRGPVAGREHSYAAVRDWLGPAPAPLDRDEALGALARRYLAGHGPATDRDLARWSGLPLGGARRGLAVAAAGLADAGEGLVDLAGREGAPAGGGLPPPRLLGAYEPLLLGWASRDFVVAPARAGGVADHGLFRPVALARGRVVGVWRLERGGVLLAPFTALGSRVRQGLEADAGAVARFLGRSGGGLRVEPA